MRQVTQIFDFVQALCAFYTVKVEWAPPFSTLLQVFSSLAFDFRFLRFSCVISDGAVSGLVAKLLTPLALLCVEQNATAPLL